LESQVQLYITSGEPYKGGCRYSVYQADNLLISQLPCPPTDLRAHPNAKTTQKSSLIRIEWKYKDPGYPCHYVVSFARKEVLMSRGCNGRPRPFWVTIKRPSASKVLWNKFEWQQRLRRTAEILAEDCGKHS
jgi:hypothetical protein